MGEMGLMIVLGSNGPPSLASAAEQLGVAITDLDGAFGVVLIDPAKQLYCVNARIAALPPGTQDAEPFRGPFSNPKTIPFPK